MTELELQGEYVIDFFYRRSDGLGFREVKNNAVSSDLFIPADLLEFLKKTPTNSGRIYSARVTITATSRNCSAPSWTLFARR